MRQGHSTPSRRQLPHATLGGKEAKTAVRDCIMAHGKKLSLQGQGIRWHQSKRGFAHPARKR
jgi:hypothetical protein